MSTDSKELETVETGTTGDVEKKSTPKAKTGSPKKSIPTVPPVAKKATKSEMEVERKKIFKLMPCPPKVLRKEGSIKVTNVSLASIVALDDTPIDDAEESMRRIDTQHVEHIFMAMQDGDSMPAMRVQFCVDRNAPCTIMVDGYHRWAAYERLVLESVKTTELYQNAKDDTAKLAVLNAARKEFKVVVEPLDCQTERVLLYEASMANLKNGLPMSDQSRTQLAIRLIKWAKQDGKTLSIREAGRLSRVSHVAIIKQLARDKKKAERMQDFIGVLPEEELKELESSQLSLEKQEQADELGKATKALFNSIHRVFLQLSEPELLLKYLESSVTTDNATEVRVIADVCMALTEKSIDGFTEEDENEEDENEEDVEPSQEELDDIEAEVDSE